MKRPLFQKTPFSEPEIWWSACLASVPGTVGASAGTSRTSGRSRAKSGGVLPNSLGLRHSVLTKLVGRPPHQKLAEMKFWDFIRRSRDKTWGDKLGGIWGEISVGHSAQQMKHENAQKISSKISPNSSPNLSPRLPPESLNFVAAISLRGMSGVKLGLLCQSRTS